MMFDSYLFMFKLDIKGGKVMKKKLKGILSKLLFPITVLSCSHVVSKPSLAIPYPASVATEKEFLKKGEKNGALWWFDSNENGARSRTLDQAIQFAKDYNCDEKEVLEIWRRYHKDDVNVTKKVK